MEEESESWFLETSKMLMASDVYAARSWLLTAKCLFPQSFRLQIEEYLLELNKENTEECSKALNELFRDFPNEADVWTEIEKLIHAVEHSSDPLRKAIFDGLPALTQQRMLLASAESRVNIAQYCRLLIVLMKKFPETVSQYGMALTDRVVEAEKKDPEGTPVNHYRRLLVGDVLPVICHFGNLNVSHKHFYKWIQKATEFYVCYYTNENEKNTSNAWLDMEKLRSDIAVQCMWNEDKKSNRPNTLSDRITFMRDLFRRSRTDVEGAVNRKQVFYTTLILLFEASSVYMENVCSSIYRDSGKPEESFFIMVDLEEVESDEEVLEHLPTRKSAAINESFQVAKEAWIILHSIETFEKDFNHLLRRWKCDRWSWFQLFLVDLHIFVGEYELALERLRSIENLFGDERIREEIKIRTYATLTFVCFSLSLYKESCEYLFHCLSILPRDDQTNSLPTGDQVTSLSKPPSTPKLNCPLHSNHPSSPPLVMVRPSIKYLLPLWIQIFMKSLGKITSTKTDDSILGHLMVLSQHKWPRWKGQCEDVLAAIKEKKKFKFELFAEFVINVDILEEVAYLKNKTSCQFTITNHNAKTHVTRGANREADDEFWKAITANIQRSSENVDNLILNYLVTCKDSILHALQNTEGV